MRGIQPHLNAPLDNLNTKKSLSLHIVRSECLHVDENAKEKFCNWIGRLCQIPNPVSIPARIYSWTLRVEPMARQVCVEPMARQACVEPMARQACVEPMARYGLQLAMRVWPHTSPLFLGIHVLLFNCLHYTEMIQIKIINTHNNNNNNYIPKSSKL